MLKKINKNHIIIICLLILLLITVFFKFDSKEEPKTCETKTDYNIRYNGYLFLIPSNFQHEIYNHDLIISNKVKEWYATINIIDNDYESLYKDRTKIVNNLNEKEIKVNDINEKKYRGTTYLILEISSSGQKALLCFSNIPGTNSIMLIITNENNKYDYEVLNSMSSVIKNISYFGEKISKVTNLFDENDINNSLKG